MTFLGVWGALVWDVLESLYALARLQSATTCQEVNMDLDYLQALMGMGGMGEMPSGEEVSYRGILVVADTIRRRPSPASAQELLGSARELADALGTPGQRRTVGLMVFSRWRRISSPAELTPVYLVRRTQRSPSPLTATYTHVLADLIDAKKPEIVLFGASSLGRDVAPRLAARLKTGLMPDALALELDESERLLLVTNTLHGGTLLNTVACPTRQAADRHGEAWRPSGTRRGQIPRRPGGKLRRYAGRRPMAPWRRAAVGPEAAPGGPGRGARDRVRRPWTGRS